MYPAAKRRILSVSFAMSLLKSAYKRVEEDEDSSSTPSISATEPVQGSNNEKKDSKKRIGSYMSESAAKLLKLTENTASSDVHAIDIASQMLHRNQESQSKKNVQTSSTGARSLLDMLPTPKSSISDTKPAIPPENDDDIQEEHQTEPETTYKESSSSTAVPSPQMPLIKPKIKSLTPDVQFDESMLKQVDEEDQNSSVKSKPSVGPSRPVGPARPSYMQSTSISHSESTQDSASEDNLNAQQAYQFVPAVSGSNSTFTHYDPAFGVAPDDANVVDINVADLVANPIQGAALPVRAATARMSGVSKAARGKNQITYLAAIAPETERIMAEKKQEQAKAKAQSRYR